MEPEEYGLMYRVELHHWWYLGMKKISLALLSYCYPPGCGLRVLDAGCGTGAAMSTFLAPYGQVCGTDISNLALKYCQLRNIHTLAQASILQLPYPSNHFDLVTSFDVLYEQAVSDDLTAIKELYRVLAKNGYLLLRLPAYDWLRGQHDCAVHTARRYTTRRVSELLLAGGFKVKKITYCNTLLFPLVLIKRLLEKIIPVQGQSSDLVLDPGILNVPLEQILTLEASLLSQINFPYGLSVFAIGQKQTP
jgi:SAM-dependent methyltransferase